MAGILDSKKRIMDTIITQEGKRQLAAGQFQIKYASFTDTYDFYEGDATDGCTDATLRIHLEATHADNDSIVIESDDSGNLRSFNSGPIAISSNGTVLIDDGESASVIDEDSDTSDSIIAKVKFNEDGNPIFSSLAEVVLDTTFGSFDSQNIIRTEAYDETDTDFNIEHIAGSVSLRRDSGEISTLKDLANIPSFIDDPHMQKIDNFRFLPPINKNDRTPNGNFESHGYNTDVIFSLPELSLGTSKINTKLSNKNNNDNIMIQMFEINESDSEITKLDLIDYGNLIEPDSYWIFAGKVKEKIIDADADPPLSEPVFIKMFSIELTNDS
jgi:hypothetical protein